MKKTKDKSFLTFGTVIRSEHKRNLEKRKARQKWILFSNFHDTNFHKKKKKFISNEIITRNLKKKNLFDFNINWFKKNSDLSKPRKKVTFLNFERIKFRCSKNRIIGSNFKKRLKSNIFLLRNINKKKIYFRSS